MDLAVASLVCLLSNADDPPFCYAERGSLKFNDGANSAPCAIVDVCLCMGALPPSSPPSPPVAPPPSPPPAPPGALIHVTEGADKCQTFMSSANSGPLVGAHCVWDGHGDHGTNERCTMTLTYDAILTATQYEVVRKNEPVTAQCACARLGPIIKAPARMVLPSALRDSPFDVL